MTAPAGDTADSKTQLRREFRRLRRTLAPAQRQVARVLDGHRLRFERYAPGIRLRRNRYGILEPALRGARCGPMRLDLVVVPLTAFDARGHRLGAGGGYYDRAFAARRGSRPRLVGYAYALQQAPALPTEPWDVRLDAVVTDKTLFVFRS